MKPHLCKKLVETKRKKPFDWNGFLDRAIKQEPTRSERDKVDILSESWVTCACGNQCSVIPRGVFNEPVDLALSNQGYRFYCYILHGRWKMAKSTLRRIEARSAVLMRRELAKLATAPRTAQKKGGAK